jgi:hypothetical protein
MGAPSPLGNDHLPLEAILTQNLASLYHLELPFLGLTIETGSVYNTDPLLIDSTPGLWLSRNTAPFA